MVLLGILIVFASVIGGFSGAGGYLPILFQPVEIVVIVGSGVGSVFVGNSKKNLKKIGLAFKEIFKGPKYTQESYLDLLGLLFTLIKLAKLKGMLVLESHIETPEESTIFLEFPTILQDHSSLEMICDYLRIFTMGVHNPHHVEELLTAELEQHHAEDHEISHAIVTLGDAFPALGIVAAVLGVILTMSSINEPPEVLGNLIGAALVGTFLGVLLSYGVVTPMGVKLKSIQEENSIYLECIKIVLISYLNGYAPSITVEFARKIIPTSMRPSFLELEKTLSEAPKV